MRKSNCLSTTKNISYTDDVWLTNFFSSLHDKCMAITESS